MQAVILCGGLGTRMGGRVKSLIPVRGRPFIDWQVDGLLAAGFDDFVFCMTEAGGAYEIIRYLSLSPRRGEHCRFAIEPEPTGTANALRILAREWRGMTFKLDREESTPENIRGHFEPMPVLRDEFLVTYGDSFIDYKYGFAAMALAQAAISKLGAVMTVCENPRWARGNVKLSGDLKFVRDVIKDEKTCSADYRFVDYGAIAMRRDALEYTNFFYTDLNAELGAWARTPATDPRGKEGGFVRAVVVPEFFHEIGSPEGLSNLEAHLGRKDAIT
jgi:NDP-sugar pyrophosphorylase family protein